jgi:hypothetical protein
MAEICFAEWVLSMASASAGAEILRQAGLAPSEEALRYLASLAGSRLSLYEVQAVRGSRALAADLLDAKEPPVWVDLSDTGMHLLQWDIAAIRLLFWQGRIHAGSGALFFERPYGADLARSLKTAVRRGSSRTKEGAPLLQRDLRIVSGWFAELDGDVPLLSIDMIPVPALGKGKDRADLGLEYLREAHRQLVRMPLPELRGRSIAEAAGMKMKRAQAAEWLKHFENAEARRGMEGMADLPAPLDLGWLWDQLGLERWPERVRRLLDREPQA